MSPGRPARAGLTAAILLVSLGVAPRAADDGVVLDVAYGPTPGSVLVFWTGGVGAYRVYRSPLPSGLEAPPNLLGTTGSTVWGDTPPAGDVFYYRVFPPCSAIPYCGTHQYCDAADSCVPDQSDGSQCADDSQCLGSHCGNGFCCATGDCCATAGDCPGYASPSACLSAFNCQGTRLDPTCSAFQCGSALVNDDSGCLGLLSNDCGPYPSVFCTGAVTQPGNQAALCATTCADDNNCDPTAHCDAPACLYDEAPGGTCDEPSDCQPGLPCADAVCCTSTCTGTCVACNLSGSLGSCAPLPAGIDPDNECGLQSCVGFYHSWSGDSCRRKADVPANVASCNGTGACRTQSQECSASTTVGPVTTTCHNNCQDPNLSTCTGTTAGSCINVNPGTQTCGVGACVNTVNQCQNGAPLPCTPLPPASETCNDVDDNCNGTIDDGAFGDGFEPNPDCSNARILATAGSDQTRSYSTMTVYPSGDWDYYALPLTETDSSCGCGAVSFDEDYEIRVRMTVPANAGSYEICMNTDTCGWPPTYCFEVGAGQVINLQQFLDGSCGPTGQDDYTTYLRIRGLNAPGFECSAYTLSYTFDAGLCR